MTCSHTQPTWYSDYLATRSVRIITPVLVEPIDIDTARRHLRLDTYGTSPEVHPEDDLITDIYLPAAREYCEMLSGRAMAPTELLFSFSMFPGVQVAFQRNGIEMPIGPALSIQSVDYTDGDGIPQIISDYQQDLYRGNGYIFPSVNGSWPTAQIGLTNAVQIRYVAGYDPDTASPIDRQLPRRFKAAILLMLAHFFENRSQTEQLAPVPHELELGVNSLLLPDKLRNGFA